MIDTVEISVAWAHSPFGDRHEAYRRERGVTQEYWGRMPVPGPGGLTVQSQRHGTVIKVAGSLCKFLQRHNVFGPNGLNYLVCEAVPRVFDALGIHYERRDLLEALAAATLSRVDLACSLRLPPGIECGEVIKAHAIASISNDARVHTYYNETEIIPRGTRPSWSLYEKARELELDSGLGDSEREYLEQYVERVIRFELRCRRAWLKRHELQHVGAWTVGLVKKTLHGALEHAFSYGSFFPRCGAEVPAEMPAGTRRMLQLWLDGNDLRDFYGASSLATARGQLLEHRIDIATRPPMRRESEIEIRRIFDESRVLFSFPTKAKKLGLVAVR